MTHEELPSENDESEVLAEARAWIATGETPREELFKELDALPDQKTVIRALANAVVSAPDKDKKAATQRFMKIMLEGSAHAADRRNG